MALNDISLTAGMRSNLLSLQSTTTLLDRTQSRLATGKKVNSALDNPTNFFAAQNHTQRASDLTSRKDGMTEAVQGVQAANKGITAITSLIEAARGLAQAARSADTTNRADLASQFNTVRTQIDQLATDSTYKGKNFLSNQTLTVLFNENGSSKLTISGFSGDSLGLSITEIAVATGGSVTVATGIAVTTGTSTFTLNTTNLTHTGVIVPATDDPNYVASGSVFITGGAMTGNYLSGQGNIKFALTGIVSGTSGMVTGMITISGISVGGVQLSGGSLTTIQANSISGMTGNSGTLDFSGVTELAGTFTTGSIVTIQLTVKEHMMDGTAAVAAGNLFNLTSGDSASGLSVHTATGLASGIKLYVSGSFVVATNYTILVGSGVSGQDQIRFNSGVIPPGGAAGSVTYDYNTGVISGEVSGTTVYAATGTITLTTGQALTSINVGATTYTTGFVASGTGTVSIELTGTLLSGAGASGLAITATRTTTVAAQAGGWTADSGIDNSVAQLDTAISTLRTQSAALASNLSVVTIREDFTDGMVNTLLKGADNLTLADMNEEGANMLMLQTRQQLSTTSLKMASDAAQAVLRLF